MPCEALGVGELHVKRRAELVAAFALFSLSSCKFLRSAGIVVVSHLAPIGLYKHACLKPAEEGCDSGAF